MNQQTKDKQKKYNVEYFTMIGCVLYFLYKMVESCSINIPKYIQVPWMIIAIILVTIGLVRNGIRIGNYIKNKNV